MSNMINSLKKERATALNKAEVILKSAETAGRDLTAAENGDIEAAMTVVRALEPRIKQLESHSTIHKVYPNGIVLTDMPGAGRAIPQPQRNLSDTYPDAFFSYISSAGKHMDAALYEGSDSAGGYAVPVIVDAQVVPLAPNEMSVRQLATVIPTVADLKLPVKASFGATTAKAELSSFGESELTLSQVTLSAFMAGNTEILSWELAQDVPTFQATALQDLIVAQQMYEENLYVNGTGSGQAQGLIGNVGNGGTYEPDTAGNLVSVDATLALTGQLKGMYHPNASFLMTRATGVIIRRAQVAANLFNPAWTRTGNQDYLHGYPVYFSNSMPTAARGNTPVLFGDFKSGYIIGDRGGSGINIKVLDQPLATQGKLVLLAYRRTDGRVRRSEAIQELTIAAS
jgi:HK97 family phage major capsid protein